MTDPLARCFSDVRLNGLTLRNRLIKAATFEGKTAGGVPSQALTDLHVRLGQGGIAMTTLGYCAAEADGRLNENMLYMDEYLRQPLSQLIASVQATGAKVAGQLSHCGNFTKNAEFRGRRPLGPSFGLNKLGLVAGLPFGSAMSKAQIRERTGTFARAAAFMQSVGFDAIEIHFGHGYGLSQFISPRTNRRTDEYGGSLHNRMRFPLEVLASVRNAVGERFPLLGKISMTDGVRGGVSYDDSIEIAALLEAGGIDAIICSAGTSSMNPMLLFHGASIGRDMIRNEKNPLMKLGMKLVEKSFFRDYPYRETYLLEHARRIRNRVQCGVCYVGGVCTADSVRTVMNEGFDFIQLGRGLLFDPDFAHNLRADQQYRNGCTHCNKCATLIDSAEGIRCVVR